MRRLPRLSGTEQYILKQLLIGDRYGLQLVTDSEGALERRSIYVYLSRMEDKRIIEGHRQLVAARDGQRGPPRRVYQITERGRRALAAYVAAAKIWRTA
jgi:DNA-binding PadR family transcriptional regulator